LFSKVENQKNSSLSSRETRDVSGSRVMFQADFLSTDTQTAILLSIELHRQHTNETSCLKRSWFQFLY